MFSLCLASASSMAATTVVPAAIVAPATTIAASMVARLVGNAPPLNITVTPASETITTAATQSGFVNNILFGTVNLAPLNIPTNGIMLTTGSINGGSNAILSAGDVDVEVAIAAGAGTTFDAATLSFTFSVPAGMTHISLDMIFATQEVLGVTPAVRDAAVVLVDGVNIAKFPTADPVSTIMSNVNTTSIFAPTPPSGVITGFGNVSQRQTILVPLVAQATHTIKIAIADHTDRLRDSAIILSNMRSLTPPGTAVVGGTGVTITQGTGIGANPVTGSPDSIAPRVRLIGNSTVHVMQNGLYIDQGAIAVDNIDGNLTGGIVTAGLPVNTTTIGTKTVTYSSTDFSGNVGTATRKVRVHTTSVLDVLPPVGTPPADILLTANTFEGVPSNDPRLATFLAGATFTDNGLVLGQTVVAALDNAGNPIPLPATLPIGKTVVTFTKRDNALTPNFGTTQATVTVIGTNQTKVGADVDLDGMPDAWEIAMFGSLLIATSTPPVAPAVTPTISDFDLDGLNDLIEWKLGTNPTVANTNPASISTDSWSVIFSNNPSDSDGDGVIDALEDATSVIMPSKVTGLPVSINSSVKYTIEATGRQPLDRVHVDVTGPGAPANILPSFGVVSFRLNSGGVNIPVRITSSLPFGTSAQFYKVNAAGVYSLIPLTNYTIVNASTVEFLLTDGGQLDIDNVTGTITDPIAIGSAPQVLGGSGPSGGCSIASENSVDPLLPVLVLFALFYLMRRRNISFRA